MNGYEDVWCCIFEFSGTDNLKHMFNLWRVCKHWNEIMSNWDRFSLLTFTHFLSLESRVDTMSVGTLPELTETRQLILGRLLSTAPRPVEHYYQRLIYRFTVLAFQQVLLKAGPRALQFASNSIRRNKRVLLQVLRRDGEALQLVSDQELLDDRQIVFQVVSSDGCALKYASDRLKEDQEIVLQALDQNPDSLEFAAEYWRSNKEVILDILKRKPSAIQFVSDQLRRDEELVRYVAD